MREPIKPKAPSAPVSVAVASPSGVPAPPPSPVTFPAFPLAAAPFTAQAAQTVARDKPSPSRARAAQQQALSGVRLAEQGKHPAAIQRLRESIALDPSVAVVHHNLGLAYRTTGRLAEAISAFRTAVRLDPKLGQAHLNLAAAHDQLGQIEHAMMAYEIGVSLSPGEYVAHARLAQLHLKNVRPDLAVAAYRAAATAARGANVMAARLYEAFATKTAGQAAEAEAMLRTLIADHPDFGEAHAVLAQILAESGRSEEAAAAYEKSISLDPAMVSVWYHFAINKKFRATDAGLIERMRSDLARPNLAPWQRQQINFALGKAYNDLGAYADSMRHVEAANAIRGAGRQLDHTMLARQTDHAIASTPPGFLARRPDFGVADETPILVVGMPRSGTTLVEQILSSHPEVGAGGELVFWRKYNMAGHGIFDPAAHPEALRRVARDYLSVLHAVAPGKRRVTDKMPFNFAHLGVISQVFPRVPIVHCRRHPIDTCLSIYSTDFEAAFDFAADKASLAFFYQQYLRLMAHWRAVLPAGRLIEVDYEALVADPEPVTRRLIAACGLEWNDACLAPHKNQRDIATSSLWQARQPIYRTSVERWRNYEPWLGALRALSPEADSGGATAG